MLELGISLVGIAERMDRMSAAELEQTIQSGAVRHATLTTSTAVWVPCGWFPMVMACPGVGPDARASGAFLPFFNEDLCFVARATMTHVLDSLSALEIHEDNDAAVANRFKKDVGPVLEWLRTALERDGESDRDGTVRTCPEKEARRGPVGQVLDRAF